MFIAVIPAFNEEKNIRDVVENTKKYVDLVVVVNDGSTDFTEKEAKKGGAFVLNTETNLGKADAMKVGFEYALQRGANPIILLDGDGQHDPDEIPKFLEEMKKGFDIVVGARKFDLKLMPKSRIFANSFSSFLSTLACGTKILDSQSGYRLIKRVVIEKIEFTSKRYQMETEMLIKAAKCGFKIGFVEINTIYRVEAKSKINQISDPLKFMGLFIRLLFWRCRERNC